MGAIEDILRAGLKPKVKQTRLVEAICSANITGAELLDFFAKASDTDKGTCADVMKHVSNRQPEILGPHIEFMLEYINYGAPRVKWGIAEAIGNLASRYPDKAARAVPLLLKNTTTADRANTTVVRWCAAYGLSEIAKHNPEQRQALVRRMKDILATETNNGVRSVYTRAMTWIEKRPK